MTRRMGWRVGGSGGFISRCGSFIEKIPEQETSSESNCKVAWDFSSFD